MARLRTELEERRSGWKISHDSRIMTIGSCFSDEVGERLKACRFNILSNPFGTVFNPLSVVKLLEMSIGCEVPQSGYEQYGEIHCNMHFHSDLNQLERGLLEEEIERRIQMVHKYLSDLDYLVITLGTAWVYKFKETSEYVSNCHKIPAKNFERELLNPRQVIQPLENIRESLLKVNPDLRFIFTLRPVRHTRDGLENNQLSKSLLRVSIHYLVEGRKDSEYFPSYEIMMDDLRDYRFYGKDLIHPNEQAMDMIWENFSTTYFSDETQELNNEIEKIDRALSHKPAHENSSAHRAFLQETLDRMKKLNEKIDLSSEIKDISSRLE